MTFYRINMKEVKRLENVSLGDQSLIALTALRRRTSGDLGRGKWIEIKKIPNAPYLSLW